MHMSDALLSPAVGAAFWAGTLGAIAWCSRRLKETLDEKMVPLMGVLGAFVFAAQMINFTIPGTGSSGHLGGGMILSIVLGPYAAFLVMASVLTVQAFFFADGGLLALGCNIWNLGIYPCFVAYPLIYKPIAKDGASGRRAFAAGLLSALAGLQAGSFSVVLQTLLSGRSELPFGTFALLMQPIHLAIGAVEGVVTAGVLNFIRTARPELLESIAYSRPLDPGISLKKVAAGFFVLALLTGGGLSLFASANPDGLEWSIEKVFGRQELPEQGGAVGPGLKAFQEKTAFMPDYDFKNSEHTVNNNKMLAADPSRPSAGTGRSVSGLAGSVLVLMTVLIIGVIIRLLRRKPVQQNNV